MERRFFVFALVCLLLGCSDPEGDGPWGLGADAGDVRSLPACSAFESRPVTDGFERTDDGRWRRVFPRFDAGCFRYSTEISLSEGDSLEESTFDWRGHLCNTCESSRVIRFNREVTHGGELRLPLGLPMLSDERGNQWVIGCTPIEIGPNPPRRHEIRERIIASGRGVGFEFEDVDLIHLVGWEDYRRGQLETPLRQDDAFQMGIWWLRPFEPNTDTYYRPEDLCTFVDAHDEDTSEEDIRETFIRQQVGDAQFPDWARRQFRDTLKVIETE